MHHSHTPMAGVHASLSGIPWWTTDVGGYGCGFVLPNSSPYMRELIVRWYQVCVSQSVYILLFSCSYRVHFVLKLHLYAFLFLQT